MDGVDGCQRSSITLVEHGRASVVASTDCVAEAFELLQREVREGPSLDTLRSGAVSSVVDLEADRRWRRLARRATDAGTVRSVLCHPLVMGGRTVGVLSLHSA